MSKFCSLIGFCTQLQEDFASTDVIMCADIGKISDALGNDKHTYLFMTDGIECEQVKVHIEDGKLVVDERGVGWTSQLDWSKGISVSFQWTDEAFADAWACQAEADEEEDSEEECDIKLNGCIYKYEGTDDDGQKCYVSEKDDLVICDGKFNYTVKGLNYEKEAVASPLIDGVYTNATVTVVDCKIVSIESGSKVTIGGCSPGCDCNNCTDNTADPV